LAPYETPPIPPDADDPAAIRQVFGDNLRTLCTRYPSVTALCRELGVNRTQFNRYMSGESFPRPDVLHRICRFFGVDARILLEPIARIEAERGKEARHDDLLSHPHLAEFLPPEIATVPPKTFPDGFYLFVRKSFIETDNFMRGILQVTRRDGRAFLRGFDPCTTLREKGLSTAPRDREYRGLVLHKQDGVMAVSARRNALSCTFSYLTPARDLQPNLWEGYVARAVHEKVNEDRAARVVYEHLGDSRTRILAAARASGLVSRHALTPIHLHLLHPDRPFR